VFAGVQMHAGHFRDMMNTKISQCNPEAVQFFSAKKWRVFLQSGIALRLQSQVRNIPQPCCSLKYIGGDGTGIGISLSNISSMTPAWQPPDGTRKAVAVPSDSTLCRCAIGRVDSNGASAQQVNLARDFMKQITSPSMSTSDRGSMRDDIDEHIQFLPNSIAIALEQWLILPEESVHWNSFRSLLHALCYKHSLTGIIPLKVADDVKTLTSHLRSWDKNVPPDIVTSVQSTGLGPDICTIVDAERSASKAASVLTPCSRAVANLLDYIGLLS